MLSPKAPNLIHILAQAHMLPCFTRLYLFTCITFGAILSSISLRRGQSETLKCVGDLKQRPFSSEFSFRHFCYKPLYMVTEPAHVYSIS